MKAELAAEVFRNSVPVPVKKLKSLWSPPFRPSGMGKGNPENWDVEESNTSEPVWVGEQFGVADSVAVCRPLFTSSSVLMHGRILTSSRASGTRRRMPRV